MKKRMALYISAGEKLSEGGNNARAIEEWAEEHDDYVRVTDYVETDYPERAASEYVPDQVKALRAKADERRVESTKKLQTIEDMIGSLEALEHLPSE